MKKVFSRRMFTSFTLFLSFLIMLISGVILYFFPGGSGSGIIREFGGLTKPAWLNQHIMFGVTFALFSLYHLFFINRDAFFSYLKKKTATGRQGKAELLTTIVLTSFIAIGTLHGMQPFSGILNSGQGISGSSERQDYEGQASYEQRTAFLDLPRQRDIEESHESRSEWSHHRRDQREDPEETGETAYNSGRNNNESRISSSQAPDDELHRRTTASCASCH